MIKQYGACATKWLLVVVIGTVAALAALELFYRFQLIDTYHTELVQYNDEAAVSNVENKRVILVMGDSFTAGKETYCAGLKSCFKDHTVINAGIPGTGIMQALFTAPRRFARYHPDVFIYQIYVGNDLFDISYAVNWEQLSMARNLYWTLAKPFRSLAFLNYKLGQCVASSTPDPPKSKSDGASPNPRDDSEDGQRFSVQRYEKRDKIYLKAEPLLLENHILVKRNRGEDYRILQRELLELLSYCKAESGCRAYVLIIPHCCQTSPTKLENMKRLGAVFSDEKSILGDQYPFCSLMREFLNKEGLTNVRILDPLALFRKEEAAGSHVYFANDSHLNGYGQALLGEWLCSQIHRDLAAEETRRVLRNPRH
jgi:hypothetical protein